jgi:hypothetical protein
MLLFLNYLNAIWLCSLGDIWFFCSFDLAYIFTSKVIKFCHVLEVLGLAVLHSKIVSPKEKAVNVSGWWTWGTQDAWLHNDVIQAAFVSIAATVCKPQGGILWRFLFWILYFSIWIAQFKSDCNFGLQVYGMSTRYHIQELQCYLSKLRKPNLFFRNKVSLRNQNLWSANVRFIQIFVWCDVPWLAK